ncbi:MAG: VCBS repeat-containing protein [Candidatus Latescibacteria bacterium]|nr:VCBS repeat-containing protein [Candidatus Latescibacterota bacterium]
MRRVLFAMLLVAAPHGAFALTWDFDDGSTWGWTARESATHSNGGNDPLHSEIVDGVWRIAPVPGRRPTVQLRSPLIGKDSALFDRLTLRLRLIHHSPTEGPFSMYWSNAERRRLLKGRVSTRRDLQPYPLEWEDLTVDLRALVEAYPEQEIIWQDTLYNIHIDMMLYRDSQDVDNHPKFLEIDWIQLTGAEELAQGELSPRDLGVELGPPGTLFAEPDFFPLGAGIGIPSRWQSSSQESHGAVGDVDGDGDADLVVAYNRLVDGERQLGWTVASNDGLGRFEPTQEVSFATVSSDHPPLDLWGSDFDGDGLLDLVTAESGIVEVWYNWGGGFDPFLELSGVVLVGLADGDGDGDIDLLVRDAPSQVIMWINDGYDFVNSDRFVLDDRFALDSNEVHSEETDEHGLASEETPWEEARWASLSTGQPLGEAASLLWNGSCFESQGSWQLTRPWAAVQEPPLSFEAPINPCALHLLADFDGDGAVDLLGSPESIDIFFENYYYGLALWRLDVSGGWTRDSLLDWKVLPSQATASDLNGDGVLDVAIVAANSTVGPALVVLLGQHNGVPVLEGYYPLPGESNQVLTSDVNGDGDTDIVALGTSVASDNGGVSVFINQGTPATAIASETAATPTAFSLGANYPNPFNPATTIPLAVPAGVKNVDLIIYNVLGQPLRQVWTGPLPAGEHQLTWDGRDTQGQPVATGVYMYRVQVDEQTDTRKMVKLE